MGSVSIDILPNELLENIFKIGASLPMEVDPIYPIRPLFSKLPSPIPYLIAIAQVCIRWRDLAIHAPFLWTYIHLTRSLESHRRLKSSIGRSLDWLSFHIVRSGNLPLSITLDTTRLPAAESIRLLAPYSGRWKSFTLLVSHVGSLPYILPLLVSVRVPNLQTLAIASDIYREGIVCYDPLVPFFVTSTPKLATIHLNGVYIAWNELPLANLLNLELYLTSRWPTFNKLKEMFDASPRLQRLVIRDDINSLLRHVDQPFAKPTIELSTLKYLEIHVYRIREESVDVVGLMGLFRMPMLETLTIKEVRRGEWISVAKIYGLPIDPRPLTSTAATIVSTRRGVGGRHSGFTNSFFPFLTTLHVMFTNRSQASQTLHTAGVF